MLFLEGEIDHAERKLVLCHLLRKCDII